MNLTTIGNITSSNWKRTIKGQYLAVAGGVALVLGAVFAGGSLVPGGSSMTSASVTASVQRQVSQADIDASVLSSEMAAYDFSVAPVQQRQASQADIAASILSTELANFPMPAQRSVSAADIMAGVLSSELAHFSNIEATAQQGALIPAFSVEHVELVSLQEQIMVTLSGRGVPAPRASEADISASVLSTELANFAVPAPVAKASDADIMAGVLSTERSTYGE